jgi:hypothetical protein
LRSSFHLTARALNVEETNMGQGHGRYRLNTRGPMSYLTTYNIVQIHASILKLNNSTPWPESGSELYRPSDRRLSAKLVPTFSDRGCRVVSITDPYGRILGFLDRIVSIQVSQNYVSA